ncbi:MAG: ABC transporter ATP-binding protein [Alphaproteobacteria bacterium]|nr:ABC transporter ATP-binding protein [Alphaproteobacteria bacterium]
MSDIILALSEIRRSFVQADNSLEVLRGCDMTVKAGELLALIGPSGSGKSTLLHIAGLLERPDSGSICIAGKNASDMDDAGRTELRRKSIGFIYQFHHLLPEFSARENIMLPQMIAGVSEFNAGKRADELLALIGLTARSSHRPGKLSGGEQQRVAIARALANRPKLLIADEPTGNLDPVTADHVFAVLKELVKTQGLGLLMATHNHELAARMGRVCELQGGCIVSSSGHQLNI